MEICKKTYCIFNSHLIDVTIYRSNPLVLLLNHLTTVQGNSTAGYTRYLEAQKRCTSWKMIVGCELCAIKCATRAQNAKCNKISFDI